MTATFPPPFIGGRNADAPFSLSMLGRALPPVLAAVAPFWAFSPPGTIGRPDAAASLFWKHKPPFSASLSLFPSDFCNPSDDREMARIPLGDSRLRWL